jgi:hypothetical protein
MRKTLLLGLAVVGLLTACATDNTAISNLDAKVTALEARVDALSTPSAEAEMHEASAFEVASAQYVMDSAGFHQMDESLNETKTVDPAYASTVTKVRKVLTHLTWPDELKEEGEAFVVKLTDFQEALEADDGESAATLATEVHEAQHALSHSIDDWLGEAGGEHDHGG